jgi:hypothetical protein
MTYTLGTAAKATGLSKSSIHRAIKSGAISAARCDDGSYKIEPAELHRVYAPVPLEPFPEPSMIQEATPSVAMERLDGTRELAIANARLEAELNGLRDIVRLHREQVDDLRTERDRLLGQVEASQRLLTHVTEKDRTRRSWWRWSA